MNWREWNIGDKVKYETNDFDGRFKGIGKVTQIEEDHAIVSLDGMSLWVDDDTADMFERS